MREDGMPINDVEMISGKRHRRVEIDSDGNFATHALIKPFNVKSIDVCADDVARPVLEKMTCNAPAPDSPIENVVGCQNVVTPITFREKIQSVMPSGACE